MSVFSIGALVGALLSGPLSDLAGRKVTMIVGGSLYALGGTLQTFSFFLWSVRFINSTKDVLVCPTCVRQINTSLAMPCIHITYTNLSLVIC